MGDDDDGAREGVQRLFEHFRGRDVEVVRRFVEQQAVGAELHQAGELDAALFAAAELRDRLGSGRVRDEEALELGDGLAFEHRARLAQRLDRGLAKVERLVLLGVVAGLDAWTHPHLARVRFHLSKDQLEQDRFARAVRANDAHPLAVHDRAHGAAQDDVLTERFVHAAQLHHFGAAALRGAEVEQHLAPLEHRPLHLFHAVDLALFVIGLAFVALVQHHPRPEPEARDRRLQPFDLLLLRAVNLRLANLRQFFLGGVAGVVALPALERHALFVRPFELDDHVHRLIQQVAIVGDDNDRAAEIADHLFEHRFAVQVQVVVRLVEKQEIRPGKEAAGDAYQLALAAAEHLHRPRPRLLIEAQCPQQSLRPVADRAAARGLVAVEQLRVLLKHGIEAGGVIEHRRVGHLRLTVGDPGVDGGEVATRREQLIEGAAPRLPVELLRQIGDVGAAFECHRPGVRRFIAGKRAQERALARAAGADQADLLSVLEGPREAAKDRAATVDARDFVEVGDDHDCPLWGSGGPSAIGCRPPAASRIRRSS